MAAMTRILKWALCVTLLAGAACSPGTTDRQAQCTGELEPYRRTLQFLTDMGIAPDTLMMPDFIMFPEFRDTTSHSHWVTADEAELLGLRRLCGVNGRDTTALLLGIDTISHNITLLLYQLYYADTSPVVLVTYDTDGIVVDMLNAGTWAGVNNLYAHQQGDTIDQGVEWAAMALEDEGEISIEHHLTMERRTAGVALQQLWRHYCRYYYNVDSVTGSIGVYDMEYAPAVGASDDDQAMRSLEMLAWAPVSDDKAIESYDNFATDNAGLLARRPKLSQRYTAALLRRFDIAPQAMLQWLYEHPESRAHQYFIAAIARHRPDAHRMACALNSLTDPAAKRYWQRRVAE